MIASALLYPLSVPGSFYNVGNYTLYRLIDLPKATLLGLQVGCRWYPYPLCWPFAGPPLALNIVFFSSFFFFLRALQTESGSVPQLESNGTKRGPRLVSNE